MAIKIDQTDFFLIEKDEGNIIEGTLFVVVNFLENGRIALGFNKDCKDKGYIIDEYHIKIDLSGEIPLVYEIGGKIHKVKCILGKDGITSDNFHINKGGDCCLAPTPFLMIFFKTHNNFSDFIEQIVIPFFGGISFFEKYKKWPTEEYLHGDPGLLKYFLELSNNNKLEQINDFTFQNIQEIYLNKEFKQFIKNNINTSTISYFLIKSGLKLSNKYNIL